MLSSKMFSASDLQLTAQVIATIPLRHGIGAFPGPEAASAQGFCKI
jgi:hypothetical protein